MAPSIILVVINLLAAKRQISLFFVSIFLIMYAYNASALGKKLSTGIKFYTKAIIVSCAFIAISLTVGFLRSGFSDFDTQLSQNQRGVSETAAPLAGLMWGYIGNVPEYLSIVTENVEPLYLPFVSTNSFILRRINSVFDYVDYERDVVPMTSGVVENITGMFSRSWAGGNLQLYIEGGYILIFFWYLSLWYWWKYIFYRAARGNEVLTDVCFFGAIYFINLFVFALRDQLIFLSFFCYCLVIFTRHVRLGRLKLTTGV